jgi:hypothetical protein
LAGIIPIGFKHIYGFLELSLQQTRRDSSPYYPGATGGMEAMGQEGGPILEYSQPLWWKLFRGMFEPVYQFPFPVVFEM